MSEQACQAARWVVRVRTQVMSGGPPSDEFYLAAIPDKAVAEGVVRDKAQAIADQSVEAVQALSASAVQGHGLESEEVRYDRPK
jgi:hypothetical protein